MTVEKYMMENMQGADFQEIKSALIGFATLKCQELLEIIAEKVKIIDEDNDVYEQPHIFYCNGEEYKTWVDKSSILNAVDFDSFIV